MGMPRNFLLIRHAESEGNVAKKLLENGDRLPIGFSDRHSSDYHLTDKGRGQAKVAGEWIRKNIGFNLDLCYTSPFKRAMETAALLQLPFAKWDPKPHLRERNWGVLDTALNHDDLEKYEREIARHKYGPFVGKSTEGESMSEMCGRAGLFILETLRMEGAGKNVIAVAHGDIIWAFRIALGEVSVLEYLEMAAANRKEDIIYNCQIFHYSREGPTSKKLCPNLDWARSIRPTNPKVPKPLWMPVARTKYNNAELLKIAETTPRMIE